MSLPTVTASSTGFATFGQAFSVGDIPSGQSPKLTGLTTQADIKNTWDDGSVKFAILSADIPSSGDYEIIAASAPGGSITPTVPTAFVTLTIGGNAYTATLPGSVSGDLWLNGPVAKDWRQTVVPKTAGNALHPFLRVVFDVRIYSDDTGKIDIAVDNVIDGVSADQITYDVAVTVNGSSVFSKTGFVHYWMARWKKTFPIGVGASGRVDPDWAAFAAAGALPAILATVADSSDAVGVGAEWEIGGRGGLTTDSMGMTGARPEIAPIPDWQARYIAHGGSARRAYVLATGDLAGSQCVHYLKADGTRQTIDDSPDFFLDDRAAGLGQPGPAGDYAGGRSPTLTFDSAHQPTISYFPYLLTGDRYYCDEIRYWSDFNLLNTWSSDVYPTRGGDLGLFRGLQTRATAWCLRDLANAAAYLPDGDDARAYFAEKVINNLDWLDQWATDHASPLGPAWLSVRGDSADPGHTKSWVSPFEHHYLVYSLRNAARQGFAGGGGERAPIAEFFATIYQDWTGPDAIRITAYVFPVASVQYDDPASIQPGEWYATTAAMLAALKENYPSPDPNTWDLYGLQIRTTLQVAVANGVSGASDALAFIEGQSAVQTALSSTAGWAIEADDSGPDPDPGEWSALAASYYFRLVMGG